jgi:ABC-type glutathione transport system ATPase component
MMTAGQYGNAGAYFVVNASSNLGTSNMLGLTGGGGAGKSRVSVYSVVRMETQAQTPTQRIAAPSAAIIGWLGCQPVAFPLVTGWNFDTPIT